MPYRKQSLQQFLLSSGFLLSSHFIIASSGGGMLADNTLGSNNTQITLQDHVLLINGGLQNNTNLLHSFSEFNVETGQIADFQAVENTQNIISRVTGSNDSWIDGTIQSTSSDANLYLVNPNGVVFGENASLDVNGAFHASTADYITQTDGNRVYANPSQGVTLTVAAPEAFGFLDASVGAIQITGSQLSVKTGKQMGIVGGNITLENEARLQAEGGKINLVAVAAASEVRTADTDITYPVQQGATMAITNSTLEVSHQTDSQTNNLKPGKIVLSGNQIALTKGRLLANNHSTVDADGSSVSIQAVNIVFTDQSEIQADTRGTGQGGMIDLQATQKVSLDNSQILAGTIGDTAGAGGGLQARAADISLTNDTQILAESFGTGTGSPVTLQAINTVNINNSKLRVTTEGIKEKAGEGGTLLIEASDIIVADKAQITAETKGPGIGGVVTLRAKSKVKLDDSEITISTTGTMDKAGNGGDLYIESKDIEFVKGAKIEANTKSNGAGGSIALQAKDTVDFNASKILVSTVDKTGTGGGLQINAVDIRFTNDALLYAKTTGAGQGGSVGLTATNQINFQDSHLEAETSGSGRGGSVDLKAGNLISFQNSRILVDAESTEANAGDAGNLALNAKNIHFSKGAQLSAKTAGAGQGGSVDLIAANNVTFQGKNEETLSGIFVRTESEKTNAGTGGDVTIQAADILFIDKAKIAAGTFGTGQGGSIALTASNQINFQDGLITADTFNSGDGGSVILEAKNLINFQNSTIFVDTESIVANAGNAGNLTLQAKNIQFNQNAQLNAKSAGAGQGGSIALIAIKSTFKTV